MDQLDYTAHSIEHIKHLFHIFLKTEERLVSVLMSECLSGSNDSEFQLFRELTQSRINALCSQIEHYNEKMQQRGNRKTSQLQFQIESSAYANQTTDMISELTCKLALFQYSCDSSSFNPKSEDGNLLQESHDDIKERLGDMIDQVNSLQQYVSVVGKGLLSTHLEQEKQRVSMDTIVVSGQTSKKDDEGNRKEFQTTESVPIERYEIMNDARSNESTEIGGTTTTDSDILDVYECEVNKNMEEVFVPRHQFCLPSLPPSLLAKFSTAVSTENQQELSTNGDGDVVTTEITRVIGKESGSKLHQNHPHHFLGELRNVMNRRTQRQQINRKMNNNSSAPSLAYSKKIEPDRFSVGLNCGVESKTDPHRP